MLRKILSKIVSRGGPAPDADTALVTVYVRGEQYFIEGYDCTHWQEAGFWVASGAVVTVDQAVSDATLGAAAVRVLSQSRLNVDIPTREAAPKVEAMLFRAMRVSSRKASMQGTKACSLSRNAARYLLTPLVNGGSSGEDRGYRPLDPVQTMQLPAGATTAAVGKALRDAFLLAK
jgi:hypothetical protein